MAPKYPKREGVPSKLDAYKGYLKKRVEEARPYVLPATVLLKEIQEMGYQGKITILRGFLQTIQLKEENPFSDKTFLDFSKHYGFTPKLCHPYRPQTKGKVERFGGYLKHSFYYPLITKEGEELPLGKLNYEAKKWLKEVADPRRLRERKSTPNKLFEEERRFLQSLPSPYLGMITRLEVESIEQHSLELYEKIVGCR